MEMAGRNSIHLKGRLHPDITFSPLKELVFVQLSESLFFDIICGSVSSVFISIFYSQ